MLKAKRKVSRRRRHNIYVRLFLILALFVMSFALSGYYSSISKGEEESTPVVDEVQIYYFDTKTYSTLEDELSQKYYSSNAAEQFDPEDILDEEVLEVGEVIEEESFDSIPEEIIAEEPKEESKEDFVIYSEELTEEVIEEKVEEVISYDPIEDTSKEVVEYEEDNSERVFELNSIIEPLKDKHEDFDDELALVAMRYLINEQGFSKYGAAGIVGNIYAECTFDASAGHYHVGIFQWDCYDRWPKVREWLIDNDYSEFSYEGQLRATFYSDDALEFVNLFEKMRNMTDEVEASDYWLNNYERAAGQAVVTRREGAKIALALYELTLLKQI